MRVLKEYPWNLPYVFAENQVIWTIDLEGLEKYLVHNIYENGKWIKIAVTVVQKDKGELVDLNFTDDNQMSGKLIVDPNYIDKKAV
jgi:hypothetical protein